MKTSAKVGISIAVLLACGGGWYCLNSCPESVEVTSAVSSPVVTGTVTNSATTPRSDEDRSARDKKAREKTIEFDGNFSAYLKTIEKEANGKKIAWKGYISAGKKEPADRQKQSAHIWKQYLGLLKYCRDLDVPIDVRLRYYRMFFDIPSFSPSQEELGLLPEQSDWDSVPFGYITEVIDPSWYVLYGDNQTAFYNPQEIPNFIDNMPEHIKSLYNKEDDKSVNPDRGINHLVGYNKSRAEQFGGDSLNILRKEFGDIRGKDLLDLGSGCGFTFPLFRAALGEKSKIYSGELDIYTLDVLEYTTRGYNIQLYKAKEDDCCMPEDSVDIINMTGVHFGLFCGYDGKDENTIKKLERWISSMHKALRPNGVLVIEDGDFTIIDKGLQQLLESNGFKLAQYSENKDANTFTMLYRKK